MEDTTAAVERQERIVVQNSQIMLASRETNIAILHQQALTEAVLLNRLPDNKLQDYHRFPLASRLGILHCIPEESFDMANATIIDVGFMGLFPKALLQTLASYAQEVKRKTPKSEHAFKRLTDNVISAFIYRPITMQQIIQIMLAKERKNLNIYSAGTNEQQNSAHNTSASCTTTNTSTSTPANHRTNTQSPINQTNRRCHAIKCRLLRAKGILPRPMLCASTKHMCSGCLSESTRHKKTAQIEMDILTNMAPNTTWAPLLEYLDKPISLRHLRHLLGHLPTFGNTCRRDDHIFGATRYIANTLGLKLETRCISENIDQPPSDIEQKRLWRMAKFQCRCQCEVRSIHLFGVRNFCQVCHFPVYYTEQSDQSICPVCMQHEAWQHYGSPCLACQCAAIVYRNPFQDRLQKQMELWLHQNDSL